MVLNANEIIIHRYIICVLLVHCDYRENRNNNRITRSINENKHCFDNYKQNKTKIKKNERIDVKSLLLSVNLSYESLEFLINLVCTLVLSIDSQKIVNHSL